MIYWRINCQRILNFCLMFWWDIFCAVAMHRPLRMSTCGPPTDVYVSIHQGSPRFQSGIASTRAHQNSQPQSCRPELYSKDKGALDKVAIYWFMTGRTSTGPSETKFWRGDCCLQNIRETEIMETALIFAYFSHDFCPVPFSRALWGSHFQGKSNFTHKKTCVMLSISEIVLEW